MECKSTHEGSGMSWLVRLLKAIIITLYKTGILIRSPQLLLLDEATSALDTATERNIQETLQEVSSKSKVEHR